MRLDGLLHFLLVTFIFITTSQTALSQDRLSAELFGRLPDVSHVSLSPDGEKVVSLVRYEVEEKKGLLVYLVDLVNSTSKVLLTTDNSRFVVSWMEWANNDTVLLSTFYPSRIYNTPVTATRLLKIDINTVDVASVIPSKMITRWDYVPTWQDRVIDFLPDNANEVIMAVRTSNKVASEVLRINHKTGRVKTVHRSRPNTMDWITDRQHNLRIARRFKDTTVEYLHRKVGGSRWEPLFTYQVFDANAREPLGFGHDPNNLYFMALHDGLDAVFKMDLRQPEAAPELVYADEQYDVHGSLIYSLEKQRVVGLRYASGEGFVYWDEEYAKLQQMINRALPDTNNLIVDLSRDERRMLVLSSSDTNAGTYYYFNRDELRMDGIAQRYEKLVPERMTLKEGIRYAARDDLTISGYLTRPTVNRDKPGPTIIFPHGGPISYDGKGFDYWTQMFAAQGYNVLQMNFRGSSGYGHDFMVSGLEDWGGKMQTDIEDGTRWLIEQKIADPDRICIVGASYGGYAALMEAANNTGLYQCAVSFAGVTDLRHLVAKSRRYVNHKVVQKMIGSERQKLKETSPVNRVDSINIPVLLAHGTKDLRVPIEQGRRMHKRLKKAGKPVTFLEYDDGNHFLSNEEHRVDFFQKMSAFLSQHLSAAPASPAP